MDPQNSFTGSMCKWVLSGCLAAEAWRKTETPLLRNNSGSELMTDSYQVLRCSVVKWQSEWSLQVSEYPIITQECPAYLPSSHTHLTQLCDPP